MCSILPQHVRPSVSKRPGEERKEEGKGEKENREPKFPLTSRNLLPASPSLPRMRIGHSREGRSRLGDTILSSRSFRSVTCSFRRNPSAVAHRTPVATQGKTHQRGTSTVLGSSRGARREEEHRKRRT